MITGDSDASKKFYRTVIILYPFKANVGSLWMGEQGQEKCERWNWKEPNFVRSVRIKTASVWSCWSFSLPPFSFWLCLSYFLRARVAVHSHSVAVYSHPCFLFRARFAIFEKQAGRCTMGCKERGLPYLRAGACRRNRISRDRKLLLSGKILRTGFSVQQFHICASRGFLTLMAAKAINGH